MEEKLKHLLKERRELLNKNEYLKLERDRIKNRHSSIYSLLDSIVTVPLSRLKFDIEHKTLHPPLIFEDGRLMVDILERDESNNVIKMRAFRKFKLLGSMKPNDTLFTILIEKSEGSLKFKIYSDRQLRCGNPTGWKTFERSINFSMNFADFTGLSKFE